MMFSDRLVLGRQVEHSLYYDPEQLCPIPRDKGRVVAGLISPLTFRHGEDIWNAYELSWLTPSGLPAVAMAEIRVPWTSPCLIESKSLKLYCNSFNMSVFESAGAVRAAMIGDLSRAAGAPVNVSLILPQDFIRQNLSEPEGICLDEQQIRCIRHAHPEPTLLLTGEDIVRETVFTRLFRSRCPVTGQPDWATICVSYAGKRILHQGLLGYLVSYREHQGFHEACVERIHTDITTRCTPVSLEVSARFTRRGGLDINPVRSTHPADWTNPRDPRQ